VLLRMLSLLAIFTDPASKACEPVSGPEASMIFIRHNRSFSEAVKVTNFSFNEGSDWICANTCRISIIAYSNKEALFLARYVFVFF
jgi:hypothetical protein